MNQPEAERRRSPMAAGVGANTRNPNHEAGSRVSGGGRERRIRQEERTQRSETSSTLCCAGPRSSAKATASGTGGAARCSPVELVAAVPGGAVIGHDAGPAGRGGAAGHRPRRAGRTGRGWRGRGASATASGTSEAGRRGRGHRPRPRRAGRADDGAAVIGHGHGKRDGRGGAG